MFTNTFGFVAIDVSQHFWFMMVYGLRKIFVVGKEMKKKRKLMKGIGEDLI